MIARPTGMTTTAGPGRTMSATPNARTVAPITATTTLRATRQGEVEAAGRSMPIMACPPTGWDVNHAFEWVTEHAPDRLA